MLNVRIVIVIMLDVLTLDVVISKRYYAECHCAGFTLLTVLMLTVTMLSIFMRSVVAPCERA
jgi:hypothetical protein